jgi:hypothetical protein
VSRLLSWVVRPQEAQRMADPAIKVIPTPYQDVLALLRSDALRAVEQAIASEVGSRIVETYSTSSTNYTQADLSVSGMTVTETETLLVAHRDQIIKFGVAFLRDEAATDDSEEYPEGEEQDPSETVEVQGLGVGFGIKYAIFYNFLANRTPAEFRAYLKNRCIPHQAKFARELRRVFDAVQQRHAEPGAAADGGA